MNTFTNKQELAITTIIMALIGLLLISISNSTTSSTGANNEIVTGTFLILEIKPRIDSNTGKPIPLTPSAMDSAKTILEKRISSTNTKGTSINIVGNRLEIKIPKLRNAESEALIRSITTTTKLTIHSLHRQSEILADKVANGKVEPGYIVLPYTENDEITKKKTTKNILIKRSAALSGKDIKVAWVNPQDASIYIELTDEGGDKMREFTGALTQDVDRIATVLDGKVLNYANLAAKTLGKNFVINGLDSKEEAENLVKALQNPLENDIEIIELRSISP